MTDKTGYYRLVTPHLAADEFVQLTVRNGQEVLLRRQVIGYDHHMRLDLLVQPSRP